MDLKKVARLVNEGKSITAIAKAFNITRATLYNRAKKDPKLAAILEDVDRTRGPSPIPIDCEQVRKLAELGCTEYEIAYFVGMTSDTFSLRKRKDPKIQEAIDIGSNNIKVAIRRAQLRVALPNDDYHGNVTMLIWLGKQYLKQTDQLQADLDIKGSGLSEMRSMLKDARGKRKEGLEEHVETVPPG